MFEFARSFSRLFLVSLLVFLLGACSGSSAAGLNSFQSPDGRYAFLYPTGWTRVAVSGGPQVVFHDLINSDETLSLVVSEVGSYAELQELGTPYEVGERLIQDVIAPDGAGRDVQLVQAQARETPGHVFYDLEYTVQFDDRERHELATVAVDHGRLYTLATSTNEVRWLKVADLFERVINSFTFLV